MVSENRIVLVQIKQKAVVCLDKSTLCTLLFYSAACFVSEAAAECTLQIGMGCTECAGYLSRSGSNVIVFQEHLSSMELQNAQKLAAQMVALTVFITYEINCQLRRFLMCNFLGSYF